jgi:AcrR family transcriptional regulator
MAATRSPPPRTTYHHGDLRAALVQAGLALAREGGPQAVVLREATRRAGVAPNAAYRHFSGHPAWFEAVRAGALAALAQAIQRKMKPALALPDPAARARAMLVAVGRAYLDFAQAETGWFQTAFSAGAFDVRPIANPAHPSGTAAPARAAQQRPDPFALLSSALDAMVQAGVLPPERRPGAEFLAWSAVHGMALLAIDGPLRHAPRAARAALGTRLLRMVETGL